MSFNFMAAVTIFSDVGTLGGKKSITVCIFSPSICHEVMGLDAMVFILNVEFEVSQLFHSPLSLSSRGSLVLLHFLP